MSTRKFTVFQDAPTKQPHAPPKRQSSTAVLGSLPLSQENVQTSIRPLPEKENIDPVTGLTASAPQTGKKRKIADSGGVLATKSICVTAGSSVKEKKRTELKRRATSSTIGKAKGRAASSKVKGAEEKKAASDNNQNQQAPAGNGLRLLSRPITVSTSTLGAIPEDETDDDPEMAAFIRQALINSKCYDLTVLPLANVTGAYVQSSIEDEAKDKVMRTVKEKQSFEAGLRDYYVPSDGLASQSSSSTIACSSSSQTLGHNPGFKVFTDIDTGVEEETETQVASVEQSKKAIARETTPVLSTPERKSLYATFTFSSPIRPAESD